jgi:gas vesicle protein
MFGRRDAELNISHVFTFLAGAIAGAAVALLFAPTSGKKLQRQIRNVLEDQYENVQDAVERFKK